MSIFFKSSLATNPKITTKPPHANFGSMCPNPPHLSSIALSGEAAIKSRAAHAAFFLTGRAQFWGSAFHLEYFIDTVKEAADAAEKDAAAKAAEPQSNGTLLVDVGAAPYNVVGGDISHVLTFLKHWNAGSGATIVGFEPGNAPFSRLVDYVTKAVGPKFKVDRTEDAHTRTPSAVIAGANGRGEWIVLRNAPASDVNKQVKMTPQPAAGDNTNSIETHYQRQYGVARTVRAVTLDGELKRRGLADREVLILKVDVEGHEMAVLRGAMRQISAGRVPIILLEYGDKMSPAIWDAMKRRGYGGAAAPSPQELQGPSLYRLQVWASEHGYDSYLLGSVHHRPILIPLTGTQWRDEYEVCRDKSAKWSPNGRTWQNFTAWNPMWEAVCWYDIALVHRNPRSATFRQQLLSRAALPTKFCETLEKDRWYPSWIDKPPPKELCCTHAVLEPERGNVCHTFKDCKLGDKSKLGPNGEVRAKGAGKAKGPGKASGKGKGRAL